MISTGFPLHSGNKTELIDLENSIVKCKDLEDFPIENSQVVYANLASMPIICGGWFWINAALQYPVRYAQLLWQVWSRYRQRFFDQVGHETIFASSGNKHFSLSNVTIWHIKNYKQPHLNIYEKYWTRRPTFIKIFFYFFYFKVL